MNGWEDPKEDGRVLLMKIVLADPTSVLQTTEESASIKLHLKLTPEPEVAAELLALPLRIPEIWFQISVRRTAILI
jgi:hypothetical protein